MAITREENERLHERRMVVANLLAKHADRGEDLPPDLHEEAKGILPPSALRTIEERQAANAKDGAVRKLLRIAVNRHHTALEPSDMMLTLLVLKAYGLEDHINEYFPWLAEHRDPRD